MAAPMRYNFIFSNQARYRISRHLLFWALCIIFFTLIYGARPSGEITPVGYYHYAQSYTISFLEALAYLPGHMLLSYFIMYGLIPRFLFKERYFAFLGLLIAAILLQAFISIFTTTYVTVPLRQ